MIWNSIRDLTIVVVGILAALWLESWWQELQDRDTEREILQNLGQEFSRNRDDLELKLENWSMQIAHLTEVHSLMSRTPTEAQVTRLQKIHYSPAPVAEASDPSAARGFFFDPRAGQLTSVLDSGQLTLIVNTELRSRIADWPALVADMDLERQIFLSLMQRMPPTAAPTWPDSDFPIDYNNLISSKAFDDWLYASIDNLDRMVGEGMVILDSTNEILQLINSELAD